MLALPAGAVCAQNGSDTFDEISAQIERKNFFRAEEIFEKAKDDLSPRQARIVEAFLDNAFNRLENSQKNIETLLSDTCGLTDSLIMELYFLQEDNAVKSYDYKQAERTLETIIELYDKTLSTDMRAGMENNLKIWKALKNVPPQKVTVRHTVTLPITKDKAGLNTLPVDFPSGQQVNFVFDTGANFSTIGRTMAERLGMKIIPTDIAIGTATGGKTSSQIAVCPQMKLGDIKIRNAIFLVLDDSALSFPKADYEIYGIIGYPVMAALREIQITADGQFIVPAEETEINGRPNMAMDGLYPLISVNGRHYTFDTGADSSILYYAFYEENRNEIDARYAPGKVSFAGAAGAKEFDGYTVDCNMEIMGRPVTLSGIYLLREKITPAETVYGTLGQDLVRQFDKMTINFDRMFIRFD